MTSRKNSSSIKGILKTSKIELNTDSIVESSNKSAKFDEQNLTETLHPTTKDYGHQKITESKTPYSQADTQNKSKPVDPVALNTKLLELQKSELAAKEEKEKFLRLRKQHYDEYKNIQLAKKLIEEDGTITDEQ